MKKCLYTLKTFGHLLASAVFIILFCGVTDSAWAMYGHTDITRNYTKSTFTFFQKNNSSYFNTSSASYSVKKIFEHEYDIMNYYTYFNGFSDAVRGDDSPYVLSLDTGLLVSALSRHIYSNELSTQTESLAVDYINELIQYVDKTTPRQKTELKREIVAHPKDETLKKTFSKNMVINAQKSQIFLNNVEYTAYTYNSLPFNQPGENADSIVGTLAGIIIEKTESKDLVASMQVSDGKRLAQGDIFTKISSTFVDDAELIAELLENSLFKETLQSKSVLLTKYENPTWASPHDMSEYHTVFAYFSLRHIGAQTIVEGKTNPVQQGLTEFAIETVKDKLVQYVIKSAEVYAKSLPDDGSREIFEGVPKVIVSSAQIMATITQLKTVAKTAKDIFSGKSFDEVEIIAELTKRGVKIGTSIYNIVRKGREGNLELADVVDGIATILCIEPGSDLHTEFSNLYDAAFMTSEGATRKVIARAERNAAGEIKVLSAQDPAQIKKMLEELQAREKALRNIPSHKEMLLPIIWGDPNAPNTVILYLNLYCGATRARLPQMLEWMRSVPPQQAKFILQGSSWDARSRYFMTTVLAMAYQNPKMAEAFLTDVLSYVRHPDARYFLTPNFVYSWHSGALKDHPEYARFDMDLLEKMTSRPYIEQQKRIEDAMLNKYRIKSVPAVIVNGNVVKSKEENYSKYFVQ